MSGTEHPAPRPGIAARLLRLLRHRWLDGSAARRLPADAQERLAERVAASERLHSGQIRICVEAGLPLSYLWRGLDARARALALFGRLRVWDTEHNNGVLIYLLLADHAIEIVADRALARACPAGTWQQLALTLEQHLRGESLEDGLTQALAEVSALLQAHFAAPPGAAPAPGLPDAPVLL